MDPNTLNLDLDQEFWPNLDQDPGLYYQFLEDKNKNNLQYKIIFFFRTTVLTIYAPMI